MANPNVTPEASPLQTCTEAAPQWPWSRHEVHDVQANVDALLAQPELSLTPEEQTEARAYANHLFTRPAESIEEQEQQEEQKRRENIERVYEPAPNLEALYEIDASSDEQTFYPKYFSSDEGQEDRTLLGFTDPKPDVNDVAVALRDIPAMTARLEPETRKQIAINSLNWHKKQLAAQLGGDPAEDASQPDVAGVTVHYDPDKLLDKLEDLRTFRRFYKAERATLHETDDSPLKHSKQVLLDVYTARINNLFAGLYPHAISLAEQLKHCEHENPENALVARWEKKFMHLALAPPLKKNAGAGLSGEHRAF